VRFLLAVAFMVPASVTAATVQPSTVRAWDAYVSATEARIARESIDRTLENIRQTYAPAAAARKDGVL
jgi:hypothetical protein